MRAMNATAAFRRRAAGASAARRVHARLRIDDDAPAPGAASTTTDAAPARTAPAAPSFARRRAPSRARGHRVQLIALVVGLALLLALQLVLAQRAHLAADARWRPAMETLCGALGCALPAWREPAAFTMLARSVRPDPSTPGVLLVEARFRNDARWAQAWPTLRLELSDVDGPVAAQTFAPAQYRAAGADALVAPRQAVDVRLKVREPAPRIVAYAFDFR
ncbi:DUF3426 domain-containing protein [Tolypothrix campylonemoides VB511288]|nr:DUF3426 domain-containing protein [Tolypothrix campylonemoides VB511288]